MSKVDLNIFTNCTDGRQIDAYDVLRTTFWSWAEQFGTNSLNNVNVFVDPMPISSKLEDYSNQLCRFFKSWLHRKHTMRLFVTEGLAAGYIKSTEVSTTDYIFQLEHDWSFNRDVIIHKLDDLIPAMEAEKMEHLRFNKRHNTEKPWETLEQVTVANVTFCKTPIRSNNPHIIHRQSYLDKWNGHIDLSNNPKRADGIENKLVGSGGYIYGGLNYPQQITHLNGRA